MARKMNVFSIFSAISIVLIALTGIGLIFLVSKMNFPAYHLDVILGCAGVGLMVAAGFLIPALKMLRESYHAADQARINREYEDVCEVLYRNFRLWRYMTAFLVVVCLLGMVALLMAVLLLMPSLRAL